MGFFQQDSLDEECSKAAKVLKSFVDKKKIPAEAIANAKGLAVFTGFRGGMYLAGAGGSGIVIARLPDGSWSNPSAFSVRSGSIGIVYGFDVYDCVCVLNTQAAVDAYASPEVNLGVVALASGPMGSSSTTKTTPPVWTYTKSRGLYGGVTVDSTVIKERKDVNAKMYGPKAAAAQILRGEVSLQSTDGKTLAGLNQLNEVVKLAEGEGFDRKVIEHIPDEETPGDMER